MLIISNEGFRIKSAQREALALVVGNAFSRWNAPFCCVQIRKYEISIHLSIYPSCVWLLERKEKKSEKIRGKRKENQHNKFSSLTHTLSPLQLVLFNFCPVTSSLTDSNSFCLLRKSKI